MHCNGRNILTDKLEFFILREYLFLATVIVDFYLHGGSNPEFHQSVKELKEKAEELRGVKEEFKER